MIAFFYSLFLALFNGSWTSYSLSAVEATAKTAWDEITNFVMNALGGQFSTLQTFVWQSQPLQVLALVLSVVVVASLCMVVLKLGKMVFSIFMMGGRA